MLPQLPDYATNNAHMFYIVCENGERRTRTIDVLRESGIHAVFHYQSLHASPFYASRHDGRRLPQADRYTECLLRLPMFYDLRESDIEFVSETIHRALV